MRIRMALDRAVKDGLIKKNPILGVKLPPPEPKEKKVLSKEEIKRFLIQAKAEGMYELFLLELTTGLRRGEILALTWDDLNFETGELHISKQVTPVGGKNIISEPKTKAAFRTIILPPVMVGLLREYRKEVFSPLMFPVPHQAEPAHRPWLCPQAAPADIGTGRLQKGALSRSAPYLRHHVTGTRHGCEDTVRHHWPCLRQDHAEYLHPHYQRNAGKCRSQHRPRHRKGRNIPTESRSCIRGAEV